MRPTLSSLSLLSFLSTGFLLLPASQVSALAFSMPEQFGYFDARLLARQVSNLQTFTGNLANQAAPAITQSGDEKRPFKVNGDTFPDFISAALRTCDEQFNACSQAANAAGNKGSVTVSDCEGQKTKCSAAQNSATVTSFSAATVTTQNFGPDPAFPDFDLICEV